MEINPEIPTVPVEAPRQPLYNKFLEAGREGKNDWWRYLLGILIVLAGYFLGGFPLSIYGVAKAKANGHSIKEILEHQEKITDPAWTGAPANMLLILSMLIFVFAMGALVIVVKFLHKKPFRAIITSAPKVRWKRVAFSAALWMALCFIGQFVSMAMYPENYTFVFNAGPFLMSLLIGLLFLPIQTWWEEFFFRGYMFQGIGLLTKTALLPILFTGTLFGLMHMMNPEVAAYGFWNMLPAYILPGLVFAMIAAMDEGLESVMGIHFANNLFGTIGVTSSASAIQANTIWVAKGMNPFADNLTLVLGLVLIMAVLWKMNKWDFQKLYR